jgi:excisionase family DNA binding protein
MSERPALTTEEVAQRLRLCEPSVRRGITRGELPGYRVGKRFVIPAEAFDDYLHGMGSADQGVGAGPADGEDTEDSVVTPKRTEFESVLIHASRPTTGSSVPP